MSIAILTFTKGDAFAARFLAEQRQLADALGAEFVIAGDGAAGAAMAERFADRVIPVDTIGIQESHIAWAAWQIKSDWLLKLDDDETISPAMRDWLLRREWETGTEQVYSFPYAWLWGDENHFITSAPFWPDPHARLMPTRFFRDWGREMHAPNPHGTGTVIPVAHLHHKFLVKSFAERMEVARRYDQLRPGAGTGAHHGKFTMPEYLCQDLNVREVGDGHVELGGWTGTGERKMIFPHGETNITLACQNKCVSCNHFIAVQAAQPVTPADFERDLAMAAQLMHFSVYNLVGGEPTLHPRLLDLLAILRRSGITDRVEITSNGQNYNRLPDAFFDAIDDLIVTPYKLTQDEKDHITRKCAEHNVHLEWHPVIFTWAAYKKEHSPEKAAALYRACWYKINRHVIDNGYFHRCCVGRFTPSVLMGLPREIDAIALDGLTVDALKAFMNQAETPRGCFVCAGNHGEQIQWREQTDKTKWLEESLG